MKKTFKAILSASRMTDMPKYYPEDIIAETRKRIDKGISIHTLALWTKHPASLFSEPLYGFLKMLKNNDVQLHFQITVTGMGGKVIGEKIGGDWKIEPNAPSCADSLAALPDAIKLAGSAGRIKLRIDPLVKVRDCKGAIYSNTGDFLRILEEANSYGITNFTFSLLENRMHNKVNRRFASIGCEILSFGHDERKYFQERFQNLEPELGVKIRACCVDGFDDSSCINARLLSMEHPSNEPLDASEPRRRPKCGCAASTDLGGWPVKKCYTGCDYCYANPAYDADR